MAAAPAVPSKTQGTLDGHHRYRIALGDSQTWRHHAVQKEASGHLLQMGRIRFPDIGLVERSDSG